MCAKPLVTVLMLAYNQQDTIDQAIRGVMLQRAPFGIHLIVADDASTDDTAALADAWADKYPGRITVLHRQANMGLAPNFMDAYRRIDTPYMAICEGDDWWCSPHKLARQVREMEAHPECTVCCHRVVNYYADTRTMSLSGTSPREFGIEYLSRRNPITNVSVLYRRLPASEIPDWITRTPLVDYAMHMLHAARGTVRWLPRPMAVYRQYTRGIWSGSRERAMTLALDVRELLRGHFAGAPLPDDTRQAVLDGLDTTIAAHRKALADPAALTPPKPRVLSRLRAAISRLLPPPRIR